MDANGPRHEQGEHQEHQAHETLGSEELSERVKCFECGAITAPGDVRGLAVAEGIVLCHACCVRRGARYDHERAVWTMEPWFDDLVEHSATLE